MYSCLMVVMRRKKRLLALIMMFDTSNKVCPFFDCVLIFLNRKHSCTWGLHKTRHILDFKGCTFI